MEKNKYGVFFKMCVHLVAKIECIVTYSDIFYEVEAVKLLINNKDNIAITYDPNWQIFGKIDFQILFQMLKLSKKSRWFLTEIGFKTKNINDIEGQYMGLIKFSPEGWKDF